ncbi:MAG: hypothetical protein KGO96_00160 [Elusimicrobia bacterium]|nr:hypothetical protein [Elusimicrobiota bacterium]MDE2236620.1 hypothetical protein [Elusimicrobiota bacterium]MDE2424306.1 hypothetical protein [Elusimicrobiota bacterium]
MGDEERRLELIRRIASVVGHELRNPLAVISNSAYFIQARLGQEGALDPKVSRHLEIVASEIARADRMIAEILAYSRPLQLKRARLDLAALVKEQLRSAAIPAPIKVQAKLEAVSIDGDGEALGDAVRRLLDNAVEAMPSEGTLSASVYESKGFAVIEVRDGGPGVNPELASVLFEPFRTDKPRGLGLGLALARKAVEAHGGRAEGGSADGGGALFRLLLPAGAAGRATSARGR